MSSAEHAGYYHDLHESADLQQTKILDSLWRGEEKNREEGEIGSESREKGDLLPCSSPSLCLGKTEKPHEHAGPLVDANREWAKETCNICG